MPCYSPLPAWQTEGGDIVFSERGKIRRSLTLPCGQCIGCRLERARQWAVRCMHEAQMHEKCCFVTLTYDDDKLPVNGNLTYRHFQLFMKRLRKAVGGNVRFFMCGEYGERTERPHYHACLFGWYPDDLLYYKVNKQGDTLYSSAFLDRVWGHGLTVTGELSFETAAYTARYVCKKITGPRAETHYCKTDLMTGEIYMQEPEFGHMSLKPGIGATWFEKYRSEVYPHDRVISRGHPAKPPRFYDKLLARLDPDTSEYMEYVRYKKSLNVASDSSPERLRVREIVARAGLKLKSRDNV